MPTRRTTVRRNAKRGAYDREVVNAILDAGIVAHVGFVHEGQPYVIPMSYARDGDRLLLHGAGGSRLMRTLASGAPACVTVTLLDGIVLARSVFHHSMNYRSVVALGSATKLEGAEKAAALETLVEGLVPGRSREARGPDRAELAATMILDFPLDEVSAKARSGPPADDPADLELPIWAGTIPLALRAGPAEPAPDARATDLPPSVERYLAERG
ncbi:MAG TPA: pyridoxamine 5'-phosphate oxidase family protein [Gemmatimonadota bacterium]|jgi:nitroimidazol reductase NimA-like FMN-containing flavoprotein (pyridoxamine 5'-phosphate oxidase superfamily)|nr:pyridoxamine 5'-phosphate oxidase family protein [Gemmatimonadota bacterium]